MKATGPVIFRALPEAAGTCRGLSSWANFIRSHLEVGGVPGGVVTSANAKYFSGKKPLLEAIVDAAACTRIIGRRDMPLGNAGRTNSRKDKPLGDAGRKNIMAALGGMDASLGILLDIAMNLTRISKTCPGTERTAGEIVVNLSDSPGMAMISARILARLSAATSGNGLGFTELLMKMVELADREVPMNTLWLTRKITDMMEVHNAPMIACRVLECSASADDAIERLGRLLPAQVMHPIGSKIDEAPGNTGLDGRRVVDTTKWVLRSFPSHKPGA